jgi:hypothetical protein
MISANNVKYILASIILAGFYTYAQTSFDEQFRYAKKLYDDENYYNAITELKRLLFFEKGSEYDYRVNMLIGECYKQGAKFTDAIRYLTVAEIEAKNTEELYQARIGIIRVNILRRTTDRAIKLIDSLKTDKRFPDKTSELNYWLGWAYMFADDWEKASSTFSGIDSLSVLKNLSDRVNNEMFSVPLAKTLSYIVPGVGQFYTGEYISGFLSLGWNVLWGYISINAFVNERIFDGIIISNFLWLRFYRGNLQNAENFAEEKNLLIANRALNYLQFEYRGLKP